MSVFDFSAGGPSGPKITQAVSTPSTEGVQMIEWLAPGLVATSNDEQSLLLWGTARGDWEDLSVVRTLDFDSSLGVANSADCYWLPNGLIVMAVGHANGFLTSWLGTSAADFALAGPPVDLTSANPTNPWHLQNIRGVATLSWSPTTGIGQVVTGSENGLICVVEVPSGRVLSQTVYNPGAQRGINAIALAGVNLAVANCAVGAADKNFWYYTIGNDYRPTLKSAFNLAVDGTRAQTFDFDVTWCLFEQAGQATPGVLASTEEGYLWLLQLNPDSTMSVVGNQKITSPLGCALALGADGRLAVTAYDLYNFQLAQPTCAHSRGHPGRFSAEMLGLPAFGAA